MFVRLVGERLVVRLRVFVMGSKSEVNGKRG